MDSDAALGYKARMQRLKEPFNSISHFVGVVLSVAALWSLLLQSWGKPWHVLASLIYGGSLIATYAASAIYHGLKVNERSEDWLRRLDHIAIFGLIAGSYTPICLLKLHEHGGLRLFSVVWGIALAGTILKLFFRHVPSWANAVIYLGMGWLSVLAAGPLLSEFPVNGLLWLVGGGLVYSVGAVIFALERPDPYPLVFGHHEIFHLFVLVGSTLHFVFMQQYVL